MLQGITLKGKSCVYVNFMPMKTKTLTFQASFSLMHGGCYISSAKNWKSLSRQWWNITLCLLAICILQKLTLPELTTMLFLFLNAIFIEYHGNANNSIISTKHKKGTLHIISFTAILFLFSSKFTPHYLNKETSVAKRDVTRNMAICGKYWARFTWIMW